MAANNPEKNICLMGHSFLKRLDAYMCEPSRENSNLRLDSAKFSVEIRAKGGLTLQQMANTAAFTQFLEVPDVCFLQIGENELSNGAISVDQLVGNLIAFANYLVYGVGVTTVVIGQLFRRQPWASSVDYNAKIYDINNILAEKVKAFPEVKFWKHRGFWNSMDFLAPDGVHIRYSPNAPQQMHKYLQSVKSAVLFYLR